MRIVALADAGNRGKTTSIKLAKDILLKDSRFESPQEIISLYKPVGENDIMTVVELLNGYRIAFCSGGDDAWTVKENYEYASDNKCDLLVTASRGPSRSSSWDQMSTIMQKKVKDGLLVKTIDFWNGNSALYDNDCDHLRLSKLTAQHLVEIIIYVISRP